MSSAQVHGEDLRLQHDGVGGGALVAGLDEVENVDLGDGGLGRTATWTVQLLTEPSPCRPGVEYPAGGWA
ncbi:hypothetical protein [Kitasatospora sp. NPDC001175]|uniref:Uncharacterized protein n=1 Tax=Kitasatospora cystarginea TaxID=58350 RepID=A0ABN3EUZ8_9ACTN